MPKTKLDATTLKYYKFLNRIRESGAINMWGASEPLRKAYKLPNDKASTILSAWMDWVTNNPSNRDR
jgi:hypothetical protein